MGNGLKSYSLLHNHETIIRKRLALTDLNGLSARLCENYVVERVVLKTIFFFFNRQSLAVYITRPIIDIVWFMRRDEL